MSEATGGATTSGTGSFVDTADEAARREMGSIPLQAGELAGYDFERPLSAPPRSNSADSAEERHRAAGEMLFGQSRDHYEGLLSGGQVADTGAFGNLAAVLGSGLAESMDDDGSSDRKHINDLFSGIKDDVNYQRQARHAASRLMGSANSNNMADPAASFAAFSGKGGPNQSLFGSSLYASLQGNGGASADDARGFPSSLSTPQRKGADHHERAEAVRRSTTPVQMFPGQPRSGGSYPASKDIGTNVNEPEEDKIEDYRESSLFSTNAKEFKPSISYDALSTGGNSSLSDTHATELSSRQVEAELKVFLWDINRNRPSRTLAILHASYLRVPEVRSACEAFGVIENFRAEFASRGIFFVSFFDIRSAQYAALELQSILQRAAIAQGSNEDVLVRYCLPLSSSSQFDESQIFLSDLPNEIDEGVLEAMMSTYGAVRFIDPQGPGAYAVEFQNLQDARQALLELESSQPWGPGVSVEVGIRDPTERKRGRELLSMISRWRQSFGKTSSSSAPRATSQATNNPWGAQAPAQYGQSSGSQYRPAAPSQGRGMYGGAHGGMPVETQYVLGPDGRYQQVIVQKSSMYPPQGGQQLVQGPDGQFYLTSGAVHGNQVFVPQHMRPIESHSHYSDSRSVHSAHSAHSGPQYYPHMMSDNVSAYSGRSHRSMNSMNDDKDNRHLMLDLDGVENGRDTRTSLMVRNIPNKYTQQMLLSEFMENGHGPGVIDFFYLPIDFKNRCNRGYAFINFVDYKDILAFHQRYFGKHWRTFNSDKICDITYARIQGKSAMLKRFENSALMEKDDEYKPLVFVSDGPDKGKRIPFPDSMNRGH